MILDMFSFITKNVITTVFFYDCTVVIVDYH